ncbi:hypothetical protein B0H34DRAFT_265574 [Crassisporium funariophilum]|nr:hypothetical protein B0H34DRAFT_265574 [Crassisporium funariophilum]
MSRLPSSPSLPRRCRPPSHSPTLSPPASSPPPWTRTATSLLRSRRPMSPPASPLTPTDPDAVVTTTTGTANPTVVATAVSLAPLPTGIPARIYPRDQLDPDANMAGFTLVSILFNQELNWPFVVDSQISSSQIFAYVPVLITTALGIAGDQVKTWALQVYVPTTYRTAADQVELGTMWLGYIPSDLVDTLAAEIKAKQSKFYTGVSDVVAQSLADRVNSGFSLRSVADPNTTSNGGDNSNTAVGASSNDSKSRQDAIIGVVSALGAIAVLVLVFLVYRSMKRRRQLAHRRLSDPPVGDMDFVGARPEGQDFDQDSVGGARRRSFYYAEDSLRGFEGQQPVAGGQGPNEMGQYSRTSPVLSQRRNVVPGMISGPVLQENSMNW